MQISWLQRRTFASKIMRRCRSYVECMLRASEARKCDLARPGIGVSVGRSPGGSRRRSARGDRAGGDCGRARRLHLCVASGLFRCDRSTLASLWRAFSSDLCDERTALRGGLVGGRCAWAGRTRPRICTHRRAVEVRRHARRRHCARPGHPRSDGEPACAATAIARSSASSSTTTTRSAARARARRRAAGALEGQAQLHDPAAQGRRCSTTARRSTRRRSSPRSSATITYPGSSRSQRLRGRRQRDRVRAVHGRLST